MTSSRRHERRDARGVGARGKPRYAHHGRHDGHARAEFGVAGPISEVTAIGEERAHALSAFYERWKDEPLVVVPLRAAPPGSLAELEELGAEVAGQQIHFRRFGDAVLDKLELARSTDEEKQSQLKRLAD